MDLSGSTLGNYQIVKEIGRGGMAVVYKAFQPSLGRYVALKVLPEYFQHDPEFVARFQREAQSAAQLSHPNIVIIYDVGEQNGIHYIAMELLEGGSLRDRLARGPLKPGDAARVLEQVASALDYAHRRGLIHRDIKPANILFTADGRPKLTDFGIARAADGARLTRTGALLGTPEYMAPEQAQGAPVDNRSDLYALGVVLYEMLTGRVPFQGTTPHAMLYAVVSQAPPPPRQIRPDLPVAVESVIMKALDKRPENRYQRGAEMAAGLQAALTAPGATPPHITPRPRATPPPLTPPPTALPRRSRLPLIVGGFAGLVIVALAVMLGVALGGRPGATPVPTLPIVGIVSPTPAVEITTTPSGPAVPTDAPTPGQTPPTPEPTIETPPISVCATPLPTNSPTPTQRPSNTPTATSEPTDTPPPPRPAAAFGRLAFTSNRDGNYEIYVANLESGAIRRLTKNGANDWLPDWSPDGSRIAWTSNRTGSYDLWVMNGDGGGAKAVVTTGAWDEYAHWAPDGRRLAFVSTEDTNGVANSEVHVWDPGTGITRLTFTKAEDQYPDWSPDGRLAYQEGFKGQSDWNIYVINADGSGRTALLGGRAVDIKPAWSPDGQAIAFIRVAGDNNGNGGPDEEDAGDVWVGRADGSGTRQLTSGFWALNPAWSPDGNWIAYVRVRDSNGNGVRDQHDESDIWAIPAAGGEPVALIKGSSQNGDPSWTW